MHAKKKIKPEEICKLLRGLANSDNARQWEHDVILLAAAEMIEQYEANEWRSHMSNRDEA